MNTLTLAPKKSIRKSLAVAMLFSLSALIAVPTQAKESSVGNGGQRRSM